MTLSWFPFGLRCKRRLLTEVFHDFIAKVLLNSHSSRKLLKVYSDFRLINSILGAKPNPSSGVFISISVKTFELKLKTVSEQKYQLIRFLLLFVSDDEFCCKSCRIEINSSSCEEETLPLFWLIVEFELLETSASLIERARSRVRGITFFAC